MVSMSTGMSDAAGIDGEAFNVAYGLGYDRVDRGSWITATLVLRDVTLDGLTVPALANPYEDAIMREVLDELSAVKDSPLALSHEDAYNIWRESVNEYGRKLEAVALLASGMSKPEVAIFQADADWKLNAKTFGKAAAATDWPSAAAASGDEGLTFYHYLALDTLPCVSVRVDGSERDDLGKLAANLVNVALAADLRCVHRSASSVARSANALASIRR